MERRFWRRSPAVLSTFAVVAAAACSSGSATGPTTSRNAELIARFDSLALEADLPRAVAFRNMIVELALGAPVGGATITVNGRAADYSLVAEYDVNNPAARPVDSVLTMYAWRGRNADTIVTFRYADGGSVEVSLLTPTTLALIPFGPGMGSAVARRPAGACMSFRDAVGPVYVVPSGVSCSLETVRAAATATLRFGIPDTQDLTFNQSVSAIRVEFKTGA